MRLNAQKRFRALSNNCYVITNHLLLITHARNQGYIHVMNSFLVMATDLQHKIQGINIVAT